MEIQETKTVWVAWTNTDNTEGRGRQVPKAVCETKATALRIGRRGYIQGSDCPVSSRIAVKINNSWLVPGVIHIATREDEAKQKRIDEQQTAIEKAKSLGLTDEDIANLSR